ncbi:hypothetical protein E2562_023710 [Oryza meyeriana var. granulata]|uniref:Uncharacterized protein n=1 Tax=Oryza meyeriana var. granulata TaxID=110450 RepID=A0A6G1BPV7_9ORYZ|nr:hypothetical protein E2562_023710 [Oryza meyeriana var. granulata]
MVDARQAPVANSSDPLLQVMQGKVSTSNGTRLGDRKIERAHQYWSLVAQHRDDEIWSMPASSYGAAVFPVFGCTERSEIKGNGIGIEGRLGNVEKGMIIARWWWTVSSSFWLAVEKWKKRQLGLPFKVWSIRTRRVRLSDTV